MVIIQTNRNSENICITGVPNPQAYSELGHARSGPECKCAQLNSLAVELCGMHVLLAHRLCKLRCIPGCARPATHTVWFPPCPTAGLPSCRYYGPLMYNIM